MEKKQKIVRASILVMVGIFIFFIMWYSIPDITKTPPPSNFIEGTVTEISGSLVNVVTAPEFDGAVSYSNQTTKFGDPTFVFSVETAEGLYHIQIDPTDSGGSPGPQTIYNIAATIKVGSMVRFPTEVYGRTNSAQPKQPMGFSKSKIGILDPDDIEIL